jgi:hypothetical protein
MLVPKILSFLDAYAWLYILLTCHLALRLNVMLDSLLCFNLCLSVMLDSL